MRQILGGRYQIICLLGKGGFGETYLAKDRHCQEQICVVKKLVLGTDDPFRLQIARRLFAEEAKALYKLGRHEQIPQLLADFEENQEFYLVQEFIDGHDLDHEIKPDKQLSEAVVIQLLQDILEVLAFVHDNNKIHRDIKPSNIIRRKQDNKIVLIDFGSVKTVSTQIHSSQVQSLTVQVGTPGYMPEEQKQGEPKLSSDIYAVGMVAIQALTGVIPYCLSKDLNGKVIWYHRTQVSNRLVDILNKMVRCNADERYKSAVEVLQELSCIVALQPQLRPLQNNLTLPLQTQSLQNNLTLAANPTWVRRRLEIVRSLRSLHKRLVFVALVFIAAFMTIVIPIFASPPTCPLKFEDYLSCGEETLFPLDSAIPEKQQGVNALAHKDYKKAIPLFEAAYKKRKNDPETLIYLNNAQLAAENTKTYTIAVSVPIVNNQLIAEAILRGVAQAQNEINKGRKINGRGLRVLIANDANNSKQARQIAENLVSQRDILSVVAYYASELTVEALPVYQQNHLVLISPGSTVDQIREKVTPNDFFFRTVPNASVSAEALADYLLKQIPNHPTAAIFYTPESLYSDSMQKDFRSSFQNKGGKVIELTNAEFNLSNHSFVSHNAIEQAKQKGATVLVLFPDGQVNPFSFKNTLSLIDANQQESVLMVGGWVLYDTQILQKGLSVAEGRLVVDVPWHRLTNPNSIFLQTARDLWGTQQVNAPTAMSYDATLALINALKKLDKPDRTLLQKTLADLQFTGASGQISFVNGDRKQSTNHLVKIVPSRCSSYGYTFVPIEYSNNPVDSIRCDI
ncbi:MAG: ABC transporter substrate-binding protein [Desmonostoc vinosum HA7617-LM4]|jgi:ABC-type branched-subunit amino acid transport system substrate-binding protein|nr:ABC transporter substrate-binding protein [Desmonostoc vinosum HA7617-LM4]